MSATLTAPAIPAIRLTVPGIVRSEWIKLRTVRSTVWSYAIVVLVSFGLAALMASTIYVEPGVPIPSEDQTRFVLMASTFGVFFGQLIVAVLGVLAISGEYSTGMIRSTLTAVPRRLPALWAKVAVLFTATFVVGVISTVGAFLIATPILATKGISIDLIGSGIIPSLLGAALYLAMVSVFSLGLGTILRNSAGGIAAALGVLLVLPTVIQVIPATWATDLLPYLLSSAGVNMFGMTSFSTATNEPWVNFFIALAWVLVSLAGAALLLKRRDA